MQRKKHNTKYSPEFKISVIMDCYGPQEPDR